MYSGVHDKVVRNWGTAQTCDSMASTSCFAIAPEYLECQAFASRLQRCAYFAKHESSV